MIFLNDSETKLPVPLARGCHISLRHPLAAVPRQALAISSTITAASVPPASSVHRYAELPG